MRREPDSTAGATRSAWMLLSALSATDQPSERARLVATGLPRILECRISGMALYHEDDDRWRGTIQVGERALALEETDEALAWLAPHLLRAFQGPGLTEVTLATAGPPAPAALRKFASSRLVVAPVRTLDRRLGAVFAASGRDDEPAPADEQFLLVIADQVAIGLEHLCLLLEQRSAARRLERRNELLLESAGEGIYGLDTEGRTTFVNPAAARMVGWSAEELLGRRMHELLHHRRRDGSEYPAEDCPIYRAFNDGDQRTVADEVFWRRDGTSFAVEYTSTPIRERGKIAGAVVVFRDVSRLRTALREVEELKRRVEQENLYLRDEIAAQRDGEVIVGESAALRRALQAVREVAPTDANVLITGETGTGKELVARALHHLSRRRRKPLVKVNCPSIPKDLFESEFFGHSKGAFTGAVGDRVGRFELADGGTVFLDEIGEIPLEMQSKLLRVLQEGEFERLGEAETRRVDVRVIAASNRDLERDMDARHFREDLYYRLAVFPIHVPPLRERGDDVVVLARYFVERAAKRLGREVPELTLATLSSLRRYDWPGNVRELMNVVERAVIRYRGGPFHLELGRRRGEDLTIPTTAEPTAMVLTEAEMRRKERANIENALRLSGGKIYGLGGAAELLGLKPTTLASRIERLGLKR